MTVFEKIEAQQKGRENTAVWMVGEQLKDVCRGDPYCAELVAQDLEHSGMSIVEAEKKIKAYADKQKRTGNCVCVPPNVAEGIIREFYGLPDAGQAPQKPVQEPPAQTDFLDLSDFL